MSKSEQSRVDFMCTEWSHPYFISIKDFEGLAAGTGVMENVRSEDWAKFTIPSWRHSVWVGVFDPFFWMLRPHLWYVQGSRGGREILRQCLTAQRQPPPAFSSRSMT